MKLSDLKKLATAFENSDWEEIHLVSDGVEIHLSTEAGATSPVTGLDTTTAPTVGTPAVPKASAASAPAPTSGQVATAAAPAGPSPAVGGVSPAAPSDPAAPAASAVGRPVLSPTPGIFWRSPSPGAPPFVDVGQRVEPDTPICIVEIMKLMNRVPAGVSGTVVAVLVGNGESVERDQPIVVIAEDE